MNLHKIKGISFGLTSGIITTLGLIVGLDSATGSTSVIIGGILAIAIADAFSDALGIHISEEAMNKHSDREVWEATIFTFIAKFIFSSIFIIPFISLELKTAITASIVFGLSLIAVFSFAMARIQKKNPFTVTLEHLLIAVVVVIATHYVGDIIKCF